MTIKPLADRVLIKPTPAEEKTLSGIIIPDSAKEKPLRGTVLAVGNGTKDEEMVVKENDIVMFGKYAGTEIEQLYAAVIRRARCDECADPGNGGGYY